ncbi:dTDP-3-amino-3,4,6-trideoxy-alpha-D-glucopyranose [Planctomycetes bacterium CA13]|uniref:dTDP-3-amino-3,4, 6-trideoxy-alpha-D-glucopyranose n=1 Tax=Novipirellula herctigrandis TaxID=2527986 RepID=A0A5C5Z1G2_9BACT|nr:dTDP-3-amino-3,4,6-trideoxy-alpha-D-glucopyranose [Planctomycetes bacterium CA13]
MSDPFGAYSRYYDLLYKDKDYAGEVAYIRQLMDRFAEGASDVLELGCGTGKHACLLAESGLHVTGVDVSSEMIDAASKRAADTNRKSSGSVRVVQGDARSTSMGKCFDCVLSLFHVVSYQTTNDDAQSIFGTAAKHLNRGGMFVFDVWYGPAVLSLQPTVRIKRMEDDATEVLRIAEPTMDFNRNRVDVNYTVLVTDKSNGRVEKLYESHPMRYFFAPELELIAESAGMEIVHSEQWMDAAPPSPDTWGVTFVARKV